MKPHNFLIPILLATVADAYIIQGLYRRCSVQILHSMFYVCPRGCNATKEHDFSESCCFGRCTLRHIMEICCSDELEVEHTSALTVVEYLPIAASTGSLFIVSVMALLMFRFL